MPVTFGELSSLTTPLSLVRLCALLFSCFTFSLASSSCCNGSIEYVGTFKRFSMVTWCLFFVLTFLVMLIHFIQFHNLLPLSWKNLTATIAALGALMTFSASFAFTWTLVLQSLGSQALDLKSIAAAVGSYLISLAYSVELHLIRSQSDGQQRGYMATLPGLLKVLQVFGGCVAVVLLSIVQSNQTWRTYVSLITYSVCLLPTVGTVLVMVLDCAARSPVPFDRLLASFSMLGVIMYIISTVVCFSEALEKSDKNVVIMSETVLSCITLLAYTVDLAFSVKLLCDRN